MPFKLSGETGSPFKFSELEQPSAMEETATRMSSALESIGPQKTDKPGSWRYPANGPRQWQEDPEPEEIEPIAEEEIVQPGKTEPSRGRSSLERQMLPEIEVSAVREQPEPERPKKLVKEGHYEKRYMRGEPVDIWIPPQYDDGTASFGEAISEVPHQIIARGDKTIGGAKHMVAADRASGARKRIWQATVLPKAVREWEEFNSSRIDERERKNLDEMPSVIEAAKLAGVRPDVFARDWPEFASKTPEELSAQRKADIELFGEQKKKRDEARKQIKRGNQMAADYRPEMDEWSPTAIVFDSLSSLPDLAAGVGVTMATGSPVAGAGVLFATSQPAAYADAIEKGAPEGKAQLYSLLVGLSEVAPETPVMDVLARTGAGKKLMRSVIGDWSESAGARIATDATFEAMSESLTESMQLAIDAGMFDEKTTVKEALNRIARAGVTGATMGGGIGIVTESTRAAQERSARKKTPPQSKPADGGPSLSTTEAEAAEEPEDHLQLDKIKATAKQYATPEEMTAAEALPETEQLLKLQEFVDRGTDYSRTAEKPEEPTADKKARVDQDAVYENTEDQDVQQAAKVAKPLATAQEIEAALALPTAKERLAALQPLVDRGIDFGKRSEDMPPEATERRAAERGPETGTGLAQEGQPKPSADVEALRAVREGKASPEQVASLESRGLVMRNETNVARLLPAGRRELAKAEGQVVETKVHGQEITVNVKPSEAQQASGNYQKGNVKLFGLDLAIENPAGSERAWKNPDTGESGTRTMKYPYGYVKRTEGADGDAVDVYVGPNDKSKKVFVVNQMKGDGSGKFDEHKAMLGFNNAEHAKAAYMRHYQKGWKGMGEVVEMTTEEFRDWAKSGDTTKPIKSGVSQAAQFSRTQDLARDVEKDERVKSVEFVDGTFKVELKPGFRTARGATKVSASNVQDLRAKLRSVTTEQPPVLFSRKAKNAQPFYSAVSRFVENHKQASASPQQWKAMLKNAQGIKKDELHWTGVDDWLDRQTGQVKREDLNEYLRASQPDISETLLGGPDTYNEDSEYLRNPHVLRVKNAASSRDEFELNLANEADAYHSLRQSHPALIQNSDEGGDQWASVIADDVYGAYANASNQPVHGSDKLQTRGGKDYRELLIQYKREKSFDAGYKEASAAGDFQAATIIARAAHVAAKNGRNTNVHTSTGNLLNGGRQPATRDLPPGDAGQFMPFEALARAKRYMDVRGEARYSSSHYRDFPNVMAHVRFKEQTIAGQKTLFVEEIQSDWHQQGRKKGYHGDRDISKWTAKEGPGDPASGPVWEVRNEVGSWVLGVPRADFPNAKDAIKHAAADVERTAGAVPDAPFKTTWPELAMKRMIRWAAEHGYDRIAWTGGKIQSDRYNLATHVDDVSWYIADSGAKTVRVEMRTGGDILLDIDASGKITFADRGEDTLVGRDLSEAVGEEIANRIMGSDSGSMDAGDLSMGGEGMMGFYDVQLARIANKLGRKFGAEVGRVKLRGEEVLTLGIPEEMKASVMEGQSLFSRTGSKGKGMHRQDAAEHVARIIQPYRSAPISIVQSPENLPFHLWQRLRRSAEDITDLDAFYDGERVWIIADHIINQEHLVDTVYHELVVHHGLRQVMEPEDLVELQDGIWRDMEKAVRDVAERAELDVNNIDQRRQAAEELMAYMAGAVIQGKKLDPIQRTTWEKIVAAVRRFFDRLGLGQFYDETKLAKLILDSNVKLREDGGARAQRVHAQGHVMASQRAPLWHSVLIREFEDPKLQKIATPDEWLNILKNKVSTGKIRAAELKWYDLEEWLGTVTVGDILSEDSNALSAKDLPKELVRWKELDTKITEWIVKAGSPNNPDPQAEILERRELARQAELIELEWEQYADLGNPQSKLDLRATDYYDFDEATSMIDELRRRHLKMLKVVTEEDTRETKPLAWLRPVKIPKQVILDKLNKEQLVFEMEYPKSDSDSDYEELDSLDWSDDEALIDEDYLRQSAEENVEESEVEENAAEEVRDDWDNLAAEYEFTEDDFDRDVEWEAYKTAKALDETHIPDFDEISSASILKIAKEEKLYDKAREKWIDNRIESDREYEQENGQRRYYGSTTDPSGAEWSYEATGSQESGWVIEVDGSVVKRHERSNWDSNDVLQYIHEYISERMDRPSRGDGDFNPQYEQYTIPVDKDVYEEHLINWKNRDSVEDLWDVSRYTHSHWSEDEDFIAHVRHFQTTTPDGKRILVLDELQSDWHQTLRDRAVNQEDLERKFKLQVERARELTQTYDSSKFKPHFMQSVPFNRALSSMLAQAFVSSEGHGTYDAEGKNIYALEYSPSRHNEGKYEDTTKNLVDFLKTKMSAAEMQDLFRYKLDITGRATAETVEDVTKVITERLDRKISRNEFFDFMKNQDTAYLQELSDLTELPNKKEAGIAIHEFIAKHGDAPPFNNFMQMIERRYDSHMNKGRGITFVSLREDGNVNVVNESELSDTINLLSPEPMSIVSPTYRDSVKRTIADDKLVLDAWNQLISNPPQIKEGESVRHYTIRGLVSAYWNPYNNQKDHDANALQSRKYLDEQYTNYTNLAGRTMAHLRAKGMLDPSMKDIYESAFYKDELKHKPQWGEDHKRYYEEVINGMGVITKRGYKPLLGHDGPIPIVPDILNALKTLGMEISGGRSSSFGESNILRYVDLPVFDRKSQHHSDMAVEFSDVAGTLRTLKEQAQKKPVAHPPMQKTWPITIMQWAVREAAERNLDGIAITNGAVHSTRWSSTRDVKDVNVMVNPTAYLRAIRQNGKDAGRNNVTRFRVDLPGDISTQVIVDAYQPIQDAVFGYAKGDILSNPPDAHVLFGDKDKLVVLVTDNSSDSGLEAIVTSMSRVSGWIGKFSGDKVMKAGLAEGDDWGTNAPNFRSEPGATIWWPSSMGSSRNIDIHHGSLEIYNTIIPNQLNDWFKKWKVRLEPKAYDNFVGDSDAPTPLAGGLESLPGADPSNRKVYQLPTVMLNDQIKKDALEKGFPLLFSRKWYQRAKNVANRVVVGGQNFDTADPNQRSRAWNWLVFKLQDKFVDLFKTQKEAAAWHQVAQIPDQMDAYLQQTLYHGRAEHQIKEHEKQYVEPLIEMIKKSGYEWEDVEDYLYARHAPEANAHLLKINNGNPAFNSGMTDQEAMTTMGLLAAKGDITKLQAIGQHVDRMTKWSRDQMVLNGLEDAATIQEWENTYQHYVPLKGWKDQIGDPDVASLLGVKKGKGFDTGGKLTKQRTGRMSRAATLLANVVAQAQATIILSEKAKVGRAFYDFVKATPSSRLWSVDEVEYMKYVDKSTGLVRKGVNPTYQLADNVIRVKIGGKDFHITLNSEIPQMQRIAAAMKNLSSDQLNPIFGFMHRINRYLSTVNTSLNPEFVVTNALRDLQTALINLNEHDKSLIKTKILKDWRKAWWAIRRGEAKSRWIAKAHVPQWAAEWEEFKRNGAKVGWIDHYKSSEDLDRKLQRMLGPDGTLQWTAHGIRRLGEFVENENLAVENALRLSTYVNLRNAGLTEQRAAEYAKNLTVNFNRKGDSGTFINSLWLFYNAAVQGSARLWTAAKNPRVRKVMYGIMAAAMAREILNRMMGEDDDGELIYDKIPEGEKERNMIFVLPQSMRYTNDAGEKISYIKVALPYGYNVIDYTGQKLGKLFDRAFIGNVRNYKPVEEAGLLLGSMVGAFSPLGDPTTSVSQFISPTPLDPLVQLDQNKAWHGGKLMPDDFPGQMSPDSQKFFASTPRPFKEVAAYLNRLTGGTEVTPGGIDISPETMQLWTETVGGGLARFITSAIDAPTKDPAERELRDIPFLRKVVGAVGDRQDQSLFFDRMQQVELARDEIDAAYAIGITTPDGQERLQLIQNKYPVASRMIREAYPNFGGTSSRDDAGRRQVMKALKDSITPARPSNAEPPTRQGSGRRRAINTDLREARRELARLELRTGIPETEKKALIEAQKKIIRDTMDSFNKRWSEIEDSVYGERDSKKLLERLGPLINNKTQKEATSALRDAGLPDTASLFAELPSTPDRFAREYFLLEASKETS